ncbi:MAG: cobalamin-dependent protein, partial [bacterium]
MKVLLALPSIEDREFLGKSRSMRLVGNYIPSLGFGYLASYLRRENVDVMIHNPIIPGHVGEIANVVEQWKPDILGLTAITSHVRSITPLLKILNDKNLHPIIILGGVHITALPEETMRSYAVDLGVVGEGEITLVEIVKRYRDGDKELQNIPGTVFRSNGGIKLAPSRPFIYPLD